MSAIRLIVIFGLVSLFADVSYEGARSVMGPFLSGLGASGLVIGLISGAGEFASYSLRLVSGSISDWTRRYWFLTFAGYIISLAAIPLLSIAPGWKFAAVLMIAERLGKALRSPPRDTLLSFATHKIGRGWGFGIHEALDQVGALIGPLVIMAVQLMNGSYRFSFALLAIPGAISLMMLILARIRFPKPQEMETKPVWTEGGPLPCIFWFYVAGVSMVSFGFINYSLLGFHLVEHLPSYWIPLLYAIAMPVSSLAALGLGRLFRSLWHHRHHGGDGFGRFFCSSDLISWPRRSGVGHDFVGHRTGQPGIDFAGRDRQMDCAREARHRLRYFEFRSGNFLVRRQRCRGLAPRLFSCRRRPFFRNRRVCCYSIILQGITL